MSMNNSSHTGLNVSIVGYLRSNQSVFRAYLPHPDHVWTREMTDERIKEQFTKLSASDVIQHVERGTGRWFWRTDPQCYEALYKIGSDDNDTDQPLCPFCGHSGFVNRRGKPGYECTLCEETFDEFACPAEIGTATNEMGNDLTRPAGEEGRIDAREFAEQDDEKAADEPTHPDHGTWRETAQSEFPPEQQTLSVGGE